MIASSTMHTRRPIAALAVVAAALSTVVLAAPAPADANPLIRYEHRLLRTQTGVLLDAQPGKLGRDRLGMMDPDEAPNPTAQTYEKSWSSTLTVSNSLNKKAVLDFSIGTTSTAGAVAKVGVTEAAGIDLKSEAGGSTSARASGEISLTRTTAESASATFSVTVTHPAVNRPHLGYDLWYTTIGNLYEIAQRRCDVGPGGCLFSEWQTVTIKVPTGAKITYKSLGWGDTVFDASKCCVGTPQPKWLTHPNSALLNKQVCPTVTSLVLDTNTARYRFQCAHAGDPAEGLFVISDVDDNSYPYDVNSFVAELRGQVTGRVKVVREAHRPGNTVRPLTMNSVGALTANAWASTRGGTFRIVGWAGS